MKLGNRGVNGRAVAAGAKSRGLQKVETLFLLLLPSSTRGNVSEQ